ncbi:50S ribosomal protein L21 [Octadecabacter antarcticus 307]|uniref:Large ribosomal subunit protein bL21 n=1 Tax=Octadecabacter antarcticus 307 TaxID=391626 RepID=M9R8U4_9RHOB|nr:50S ribosomal protein L21 [Octadecabacter antarcticus]AGI68218.1 50S ribosomal protein L21 [Octadecabacter antarcticus 307]
MFAVLKTGGKQYRVTTGDVLRVEKIAAETGDKIQFNEILMVGKNVGAPVVDDAGVQAEVIDQIKGEKTINFVKRRRKHSSKRTKGHRQQLTLVRIGAILETGAGKSGVMAALNGTGFMSASMIERAANKGAPSSLKAAANAERASQPKRAAKTAAPKAAPKAAKPVAETEAPAGSDDLTAITGVGPAAAKKLVAAGVTSYAALAAVDVDTFDAVKVKPEWVAQAADLAK